MRFIDIILKKRDGFELNEDEIKFFINSIKNREVPDYQVSSLLMAIYFNGMSFKETSILTKEMANSGKICDLSFLNLPSVDKHSTGGVGDKISIILAPLVASFDIIVPMMSGRGLGHTGGTLDKLESIPGFNVFFDINGFYELLKKNKVAMIGQTEDIAPADKYLYALRDSTGTVESIPLITSSIMSKKIAEGTKNLVIDLKVGKGAFMKDIESSRKLGEFLIETGRLNNIKTVCILTNMDEPLGYTIGNSLEIIESIEILKGNFYANDVVEITLELSAHMLHLAKGIEVNKAKDLCYENLKNGKALQRFCDIVKAQNGDQNIIMNYEVFKKPKYSKDIYFLDIKKDFNIKEINNINFNQNSSIESIDSYKIGLFSCILGAGRTKKEDKIDPSAGIVFYKKTGDLVSEDDKIMTLFSDSEEKINDVKNKLKDAIIFSNNKPEKRKLIIEKLL
ncbi:MAG: thymidine phosphorylase [Spirochaetes bacterium]|nr:thymidine phosphorylase [Spirochaetota bacterium]